MQKNLEFRKESKKKENIDRNTVLILRGRAASFCAWSESVRAVLLAFDGGV